MFSFLSVVPFSVTSSVVSSLSDGDGHGGVSKSSHSKDRVSSTSSSSSSSAPSSDHVLFELQSLFYVACKSLRISAVRKELIGRCFDSGHGSLEEDVQWFTPAVQMAMAPTPSVGMNGSIGGASSSSLPSSSSSSSSTSTQLLTSLQDPWLLVEGLSSSPFIDFMYEHSKINTTTHK